MSRDVGDVPADEEVDTAGETATDETAADTEPTPVADPEPEYYIESAKYGQVDLVAMTADVDFTDSFNQQLKAGTRTFYATPEFLRGDTKVLVITYVYKGKHITEICKDGESITLPTA